MRHALPPRLAAQRAALRRSLAPHRPRSSTWSRVPDEKRATRTSDLILAILGVTLLGGIGLAAGVALVARSLGP